MQGRYQGLFKEIVAVPAISHEFRKTIDTGESLRENIAMDTAT